MTEENEQAGPVVKVARDLTEIERLAETFHAQAVARASDKLMPGGAAMVALSPDADLDEWSEMIAAAELRHFATCDEVSHGDCVIHGAEHVADEDDQNDEDPLRTLLFWSDAWRTQYGYPLEGRTPTLISEARFIRHFLDAAWRAEEKWDDFAADMNRARRRVESIVLAGRRVERTRVPCSSTSCPRNPLLIKVYQHDEDADHWKCTACKLRYDRDEFSRAYAKHLRSEGARKFVPLRDAVDLLKSQGRPERTIRKWLAEGDVEMRGTERQREVWWPDLWTLHLTTQTRERKRSA